jgi:hypothetical protein
MTQGFDLAASLARGVEDRSGAWSFIQGFAVHWAGALETGHGWSEADLVAAEEGFPKTLVRSGGEGHGVRSRADLDEWASARTAAELAEPFTFVADAAGALRLAPRRSEHVACAGGGTVLSAGEISFCMESGRWAVNDVSNRSTGYCPDVSSWPAVAYAWDR